MGFFIFSHPLLLHLDCKSKWLKPDLFAISMEGKVGYWGKMGSFIFIDLKEGEGK